MINTQHPTQPEREKYYEALCDAIEALHALKEAAGIFYYAEALALMEHQVDAEAARLREAIDAKA